MFSALAALLGALGGGALRLLPEFIDVWRSRQNSGKALELARIDLEKSQAQFANAVELAKLQQDETEAAAQIRLELTRAEAQLAAQRAQGERSGVRLVDALNLSVRPIVTFWLLLFYTMYKVIVVYDALNQGVAVATLAPILRTDSDVEIFSGVITFWFVDQALVRRRHTVANDMGS